MRKSFIVTLTCGVMFGGMMFAQPASAVTVVPSAAAIVSPAVSTSSVALAVQSGHLLGAGDADVIKVRKRGRGYRGSRRGRHYHRRRGSSSFGAGLAVGVIGALIAKGVTESAARSRYDRCARTYRSFDYETGTIITNSGREVLCPYLR